MLMIRPRLCLRKCGIAARQAWNTPSTLMRNVSSQSCLLISANLAMRRMPTLLTRMSSLPSFSSSASRARCGAAGSFERADALARRLGGAAVDVDRTDIAALLRQAQRDAGPDSRAGAGHDRGPAFECIHDAGDPPASCG